MKEIRPRPTSALRSGESALLFVYGSLRRGGENHRFLDGARFLGEARTEPGHQLLDLGRYPGMVAAAEGRVLGELFEVDGETLAALDRFEGHPTFYQRRPVRLDGDLIAWSYFLVEVDAEAKPVPGGCWPSGRS
ncbi:MAG TPA: gamma-glutamylcyclotransferase family protein [Thermoanaerobaculia bacterium]|nr:gamma-glutamylcyclotransferase family protein [Thermoanaerobaculia bacterium]